MIKKAVQDSKFKHIKLTPVQQVPVEVLTPNPLNAIFNVPNGQDLARLEKDIQERGIIVPLVAKKNGTLLAGHCRLAVAKLLGMKKVPLQYVTTNLSATEEQKFVIMDNVARRQLSHNERMQLYRMVYPEFEMRVMAATHTRGRKSKELQESSFTLTASSVAQELGLSKKMVATDMQAIRLQHTRAKQKLCIGVDVSCKDSFTGYLSRCSKLYALANKETRKYLDEVLKNFADFIRSADTTDESIFKGIGIMHTKRRNAFTKSRKLNKRP